MDKTTKIGRILAKAGIEINGPKPWDIQINEPKFFDRITDEPSIGAGESYMDGWWDCQRLEEMFSRILRFIDSDEIYNSSTKLLFLLKNFFINAQSRDRAHEVAKVHYNLGNDLYSLMLGKSMAYTCAYWKDAKTLDEAQFAKYDLICRKLYLKPGEKVLELGCGFGGFAKWAAENYGVEMISINISEEQMRFARQLCQGLSVQLFECDYRDVATYNPANIKFDKAVSIGLCEHVGHKNYHDLMKIVNNNLKEDGLFLLHTIAKNISNSFTDPWIQKYIFPQAELPTLKLLCEASESFFITEDIHNIGVDYDKTLIAWYDNFEQNWQNLTSQYDERFRRMWRYYLLSSAGGFRARAMQLYQFVLSPQGVINGYVNVR